MADTQIKAALTRFGRLLMNEARLALGLDCLCPATSHQAIRQWLRDLQPAPLGESRILVTAFRSRTWIEWAPYLACVARQLGIATTIVYSSEMLRTNLPGGMFEGGFWNEVRRIPDVELLDLDACPLDPAIMDQYRPMFARIAPAALAYDLHLEEADILNGEAGHADRLSSYIEANLRRAARFHSLIRKRAFSRFLCYSGLIAESSILLQMAVDQGLETVCLEGWSWRPGHMIYNHGAPALEYNVPGWQRAFGSWDESKEREITSYMKFLDGRGRDMDWLQNFYLIQRSEISRQLPPEVASFLEGIQPVFLLAPNVIGDSSMLRRETIFAGQQAWTRELIAWFRARPEYKLLIRAHPAESWVGSKCLVRMAAVAREAAIGAGNVLVLDEKSPVNTFSLLPFARAGLVWLSSVGVDMVVRGLPVLAAARPKYTGLGVVSEPGSKEEYFRQLAELARLASYPTETQRLAGRKYLYLTFRGFSFPATGRDYTARTILLNRMPEREAHDRFYRIVLGLETAPDRIPPTG